MDDLEIFEIEGRPCLLDREKNKGWVWSDLKWGPQSPQFIRSHFDGRPIEYTEFQRLFPRAAQSLDDCFLAEV